MELVKCSECGKSISDKAKTCPGCGCASQSSSSLSSNSIRDDASQPPRTSDKNTLTLIVALLSIVVVVLSLYVFNFQQQIEADRRKKESIPIYKEPRVGSDLYNDWVRKKY
jgi:uncharacterized membrane protein YvbJ